MVPNQQPNTTGTRLIGMLLLLGAIGVFIPYTILTIIFDYPDILREETGEILRKFNAGGSKLIVAWFLFAIMGLPLLIAIILIGQRYEKQARFVRVATTLGVIAVIVQMIGLLRWTFVVPVLSSAYVNADKESAAAITATFKAVHQFGGVLLGEHLGQLFTIAWTVMINAAFYRLSLFPGWVSWVGYISSAIYLIAQLELFHTVIPSVPVWDMAGFIGSTLWLVWLVIVGIYFFRKR